MVETGQNLDVALTLAQNARRIMPNAPSTADTLAWVYYHKGTYLTARDMLEEALKTAPDGQKLPIVLELKEKSGPDAPAAPELLESARAAMDKFEEEWS